MCTWSPEGLAVLGVLIEAFELDPLRHFDPDPKQLRAACVAVKVALLLRQGGRI